MFLVKRRNRYLTIKPDDNFNPTQEQLDSILQLGFTWSETWQNYATFWNEQVLLALVEFSYCSFDGTVAHLIPQKSPWSDTKPLDLPCKRKQFYHQRQGNRLLLEQKKFMLAWEMGCGKSNPVVVCATYLIDKGEADYCFVVTDNAILADTWVREHIPADSHYQGTVLMGTKQERIWNLKYSSKHDKIKFFVINYAGLRVLKDTLPEIFTKRTIVVLDESQRIKDHTTGQFKVIYALMNMLETIYCWALTGTPITQRPEDIFGQGMCICRKAFGTSWFNFRAYYVISNPRNQHHTIGYKNMDTYMDNLHSFCDRRTKDDVGLDLPPKTYTTMRFPLPPELQKIYDYFRKTKGVLRLNPDDLTTPPAFVCENPLTILAKSRQIVSNWYYPAQSTEEEINEEVIPEERAVKIVKSIKKNPKLDFIKQVLEDTSAPAIVWFAHRADKVHLMNYFDKHGITYVLIDGSVPSRKRYPLAQDFEHGRVQVLLAHPAACGTGITLLRARLVFYYNNVFSIAQRLQSEDRCHRIGLVHPVTYYDLVWQYTIEEAMLESMHQKIQLSRILVDRVDMDKLLGGTFWMKAA